MALFKATAEGNVPMTAEEEAQMKEFWNEQKARPIPKPRKSLEERLLAIEERLTALEQTK